MRISRKWWDHHALDILGATSKGYGFKLRAILHYFIIVVNIIVEISAFCGNIHVTWILCTFYGNIHVPWLISAFCGYICILWILSAFCGNIHIPQILSAFHGNIHVPWILLAFREYTRISWIFSAFHRYYQHRPHNKLLRPYRSSWSSQFCSIPRYYLYYSD